MSKSDYAENKVLDWCVGRSISPITPYIALFSAAPSDTGGGTEPTGIASYARKLTSGSDWATSSAGSVSNIVNLDFTQASANYPAPITHWGIFDAASGGNLIRWAALTTPRSFA